MLKWSKSSDGATRTACGRYAIAPLFMSCERPQAYDLWFTDRTGARHKILSVADTQRQCKEFAAAHVID